MKSIKDVYKIGTGPSSSHTMGPENAAKYIIKKFENCSTIDVVLYGSLALTGKGHLTDYIIKKTLGSKCNNIIFDLKKKNLKHENTMEFLIDKTTRVEVLSIGGGDIIVDGESISEDDKQVYPHENFTEIRKYCNDNKIELIEYIREFDLKLFDYLDEVLSVMFESVKNGLEKEDIIPGILKVKKRAKLMFDKSTANSDNRLMSYAYAVNEQNASGEVIVTAPTCGACGVLPAMLYYASEDLKLERKVLIDALAIAGLFGAIIKNNASISGAEAGCQAEVGSATAMTAAAYAFIQGGNLSVIESAAEVGLEHQLGLTCDPVYGYVQIPCIQRNAMGVIKAKNSAQIAMMVSEHEIVDFDTIVQVMYETGKDMHVNYRETSIGGLANVLRRRLEEDGDVVVE